MQQQFLIALWRFIKDFYKIECNALALFINNTIYCGTVPKFIIKIVVGHYISMFILLETNSTFYIIFVLIAMIQPTINNHNVNFDHSVALSRKYKNWLITQCKNQKQLFFDSSI